MNEIIYDCRWSTELDDIFIIDFCQVEDAVFNNGYSKEYLKKKYLENIYGPSVLVVVYIDGKASAARALWRNDLNGREAYQPGDTCVMDNCRGKGVFTEMTKRSVAKLPQDAIIYNYPNQYSFPGYIKMGWKNIKRYYVRLFFSSKQFDKEHPVMMDHAYFNWWVRGNPNMQYIKKGYGYYLVRKYPRPFCYKVVAKVSKDIAQTCIKAPRMAIYIYDSTKMTFYNKKTLPLRPVVRNQDVGYIPLWKIDAI